MANFIDEFNLRGAAEDNSSSSNAEGLIGEVENGEKQAHFYGTDDWGEPEELYPLWLDSWFYQDKNAVSGDWNFNDFVLDVPTPTFQEENEKLMKISAEGSLDDAPKQAISHPFSFASLGLLSDDDSRFKRFTVENQRNFIIDIEKEPKKVGSRKLSPEQVLRIAGARFIQSSQKIDDLSMMGQPYLSNEIQLAQDLLASAEKVANRQFDVATKLLNLFDQPSFKDGTPVERVVYYFAEALREKIERETGKPSSQELKASVLSDIEDAMTTPDSTALAVQQRMPFVQVAEFTAIQAILENVAGKHRIHIIDFAIRSGVQWTALMQDLSVRYECPVQLLKITAVGTASKQKMEKTGERLMSFAETVNLPFSFKVIMVEDMLELNDGLFELDSEEANVVYLSFILRTMIACPNRLQTLMKVVKTIKPCVVVLNEVEANLNSVTFVNRFIEAVFFFGLLFDCLEACMSSNDAERINLESTYFSQGIRNIIASEGSDRTIRLVSIDVWRSFFSRFLMEEMEFSASSLYQVSLVLKEFACGASITLHKNGKCLILGWKGTPVQSISLWKF